jgi:hypothetical protein
MHSSTRNWPQQESLTTPAPPQSTIEAAKSETKTSTHAIDSNLHYQARAAHRPPRANRPRPPPRRPDSGSQKPSSLLRRKRRSFFRGDQTNDIKGNYGAAKKKSKSRAPEARALWTLHRRHARARRKEKTPRTAASRNTKQRSGNGGWRVGRGTVGIPLPARRRRSPTPPPPLAR